MNDRQTQQLPIPRVGEANKETIYYTSNIAIETGYYVNGTCVNKLETIS